MFYRVELTIPKPYYTVVMVGEDLVLRKCLRVELDAVLDRKAELLACGERSVVEDGNYFWYNRVGACCVSLHILNFLI